MRHVIDPSSLKQKEKDAKVETQEITIFILKSVITSKCYIYGTSIACIDDLTIKYIEETAKARGIATEVILSIGPFRYVCL